MKDGILIIDKEKDMTSRDVVNQVCKVLNTKKVGHTGTLDPLATGVLVLGVNNGTKIIDLLTSNDKEYIAEVLIGIQTDTLDVTGNIVEEMKNFNLDNDKLVECLNSFKGKYIQEVPKYSAVKIKGKKLYEYARENIDIELPKREVEIKDIELIDGISVKDNNYYFQFKVSVSKGTYIRSLINDISTKIGIPMTMNNLRRIRQGIFKIEDAYKLNDISNNSLISIKEALLNYDIIKVDDDLAFKINNGCKIKGLCDKYILYVDKNDDLLAIYMNDENDGLLKPYRVFRR